MYIIHGVLFFGAITSLQVDVSIRYSSLFREDEQCSGWRLERIGGDRSRESDLIRSLFSFHECCSVLTAQSPQYLTHSKSTPWLLLHTCMYLFSLFCPLIGYPRHRYPLLKPPISRSHFLMGRNVFLFSPLLSFLFYSSILL